MNGGATRARPFDVLAATYDSVSPRIFAWAAAETSRVAAPEDHEVWLDIGTGPGAGLAGYAAGPRLTLGLDRSLPMLQRARHSLPRRARLVAADVRYLPLRARSVDVVTAASLFGFLCTTGPQWTELARVLGDNGRCVASFWQPAGERQWAWLARTSVAGPSDSDPVESYVAAAFEAVGLAPSASAAAEITCHFQSFRHYVGWQMTSGLGLALRLAGSGARREFFREAASALGPEFRRGPVPRTFRIKVVTYRRRGDSRP